MKTMTYFCAMILAITITAIGCSDSRSNKLEATGIKDMTYFEGISPDVLPAAFHDFLDEAVLNSFLEGPSYAWMTEKSISLDPEGEWKMACGLVNPRNANRKGGLFKHPLTMAGRSFDQVYFMPDEQRILVMEKAFKDELGTCSVISQIQGQTDYVGYINHQPISDEQILYYGWIYQSNNPLLASR